MKKYLFIFCLSICSIVVQAQQFNADSLMHIVETATHDSVSFNAFKTLGWKYGTGNADSLISYSKRAIALGQLHHNPHLEVLGDLTLGHAFYRNGNLAQLQSYTLKAAAILNRYPDNSLEAQVANFYSFFQPTDSLKIHYAEKAVELYLLSGNKTDLMGIAEFYGNLSGYFMSEGKLDSALNYGRKGYDIAIILSKENESSPLVYVAVRLTQIHLQSGQFDLAHVYAKMSLAEAEKSPNAIDLDFGYGAMALYFDSTHQQDSAFYYYSKLYNQPDIGFYNGKIRAANRLYQYYKQKNETDSALKYAGIYIAGNDSLNNTDKKQQMEKINLQENMRQQQLVAQQAKEKETKKHNIQLGIIAFVILVCVMLFLLMSRSFMVSHKTIEMLGVVMLLIVFEFINLLLHDYLVEVTNNSPALVLLALVIIAAMIVPLHHRLEKWATKTLVEKNKEVRLAKAKKIVGELEKN